MPPRSSSSTPPKTAARCALLLLVCADNLPSGDLLSPTLSGLELLRTKAALLYEGACAGVNRVHL